MLTHYLKSFSTLRSDTSRTRWTAATKFRAPHKPLLLLAVIDLLIGDHRVLFETCQVNGV
jgi:putative restriction endonuclease